MNKFIKNKWNTLNKSCQNERAWIAIHFLTSTLLRIVLGANLGVLILIMSFITFPSLMLLPATNLLPCAAFLLGLVATLNFNSFLDRLARAVLFIPYILTLPLHQSKVTFAAQQQQLPLSKAKSEVRYRLRGITYSQKFAGRELILTTLQQSPKDVAKPTMGGINHDRVYKFCNVPHVIIWLILRQKFSIPRKIEPLVLTLRMPGATTEEILTPQPTKEEMRNARIAMLRAKS